MAKIRRIYECRSCGHSSPAWLGRCPGCGAWNSFIEERADKGPPATGRPGVEPIPLSDVDGGAEDRLTTGIGELDRMLGGGLVPGSVTLIGGDPGIGKSTLVLQALARLSTGGERLYVSAEESPAQVRLRAERLGVDGDKVVLLPAVTLEDILQTLARRMPSLVVVDSIQMIHSVELPSAAGSVAQVREAAARLTEYAKQNGVPVFIIGHVTKDGTIAGPRVLEHIVDTVLYFEGDGGRAYRVLRAVKNRFGSTNEIGVFRMTGRGLEPVENPSEIFIAEHSLQVPGSAVTASVEGTRPLLVEIQALTSPTSFGNPRRTALGIDANRLHLLLAVLEKRAGLHMGGLDVYVNVVGGLKLDDTASDLAVAAAVASSLKNRPLPPGCVLFGEIGLSGELRGVSRTEARLREASKLGFERVVLPAATQPGTSPGPRILGVAGLREALDAVFD